MKSFPAFLTFEHPGFQEPPPFSSVLSEVGADVSEQLLLSSEASSTVLAGVSFVQKVCPQVVLHRQLIGVGVVANGAVIFTCFMRVFVVHQASCMAISAPTLVARERSPVAGVL